MHPRLQNELRRGLAAALLCLAACRHSEPADLVLRHGAIYPLATDSLRVETLAVRDGRVVYSGTDQGARRLIGSRTEVRELGGRMVLPAFRDTHVHPRGGINLSECTLDGLRTREAVLDSLKQCAVLHPERPWLRGRGWQLPVFPGANPRKEWLDLAIRDRPAFVVAADGHSAWVNSKALALAEVTRDTKDPANGRIERDPRTGDPSGTLRDRAMDLVSKHLPARSQEEIRA